jgi:hypothetical protein
MRFSLDYTLSSGLTPLRRAFGSALDLKLEGFGLSLKEMRGLDVNRAPYVMTAASIPSCSSTWRSTTEPSGVGPTFIPLLFSVQFELTRAVAMVGCTSS